jgi:hypothetical protein
MKDKNSVQLQDNSFPGQFPDMCICCSKPKETELVHTEKKQEVENNRTLTHNIEIRLPYCEAHEKIAQRNKKLENAIIVIAGIVFFTAMVATLVWLWPKVEDLVAAIGIFIIANGAGYIVGIIAFLFVRHISNFIIKRLSGYPIDHPFGVSVTAPKNTNTINFTFKNFDFEKRFKEINVEHITIE